MILSVDAKTKEIDLSYFKDYGGEDYSESYRSYTTPPEQVTHQLVQAGVVFKTILDVGCASGELVKDFRNLGFDAYGIEKNKEILKKCVVPEYCSNMDMRNLKQIPPNTFDVLYTNSLMYLYPQEVVKVLKGFHRIVGQAVYLCVPFLGDPEFKDPYRVFLASRAWWKKQFKEAGFKAASDSVYLKV